MIRRAMDGKRTIRMEIPTEYQECRMFWDWILLHPEIHEDIAKHVNEGKRDPRAGKNLKLIGMRRGLLDYQYFLANQKYHSLLIEMKRRDPKLHKKDVDQERWIARLNKNGFYATYAYGWEDAVRILKAYRENKL